MPTDPPKQHTDAATVIAQVLAIGAPAVTAGHCADARMALAALAAAGYVVIRAAELRTEYRVTGLTYDAVMPLDSRPDAVRFAAKSGGTAEHRQVTEWRPVEGNRT